MTGPDEPDWGFPEVDPASIALPPDDDILEALDALSSRADGEGPFDTGSDAWWRAQASAQREAAATEPPVEPSPPATPSPIDTPPALVQPQVLLPETPAPMAPPVEQPAPSPLDVQWLPEDLPSGPPREAPLPVAPLPVPPVRVEPAPVEPQLPVAPPEPPAPPAPVEPPVPPSLRPAARPAMRPAGDPLPVTPPRPMPRTDPAPAADPNLFQALRQPPEPPPVGRRQALLGALLAVLGVVVGIVLLYLFRHDGDPGRGPTVALPTPTVAATQTITQAPTPTVTPSLEPTASPTPAAQVTTAPPVVAPIRPVLVLNNSKVKGLADRSAAKFRAGGWPVSDTGNYRGGVIAQTTIYYAPGQLESAQRFAKQFGIPRVLPRFSGLPGSGLTVVLTRYYA